MNSKALRYAYTASRDYNYLRKEAKRSVLKELAAFGFSAYDMHVITGATIAHATKVTGVAEPTTVWRIGTLDALTLVAVSYEDDEQVSPVLVRRIVQWGTPLRSIARLTGVPLEVLREAVR